MGEVPQDTAPADKEDSTEYSADFELAALSPILEPAYKDIVVSPLLTDTYPAAPTNIVATPANIVAAPASTTALANKLLPLLIPTWNHNPIELQPFL